MSERVKRVSGARILVERDKSSQSVGGIQLPEASRQDLNTGSVRHAGETSVYHKDDRILFYPGEALPVECPGEGTLWCVTDDAVIAVLERVNA